MLSFDEALSIVLESSIQGASETVSLVEAAGRILYSPAISRVDLPPFTTSSVDGYAIRVPCPTQLTVSGELPAGPSDTMTLAGQGHAVQVFTGSRLPTNADAVVMVEDTEREGDQLTLRRVPIAGENLRIKGEEIKRDESLLYRGVKLTPPALGLLASSGQAECTVFKRPRVVIIETGNELRSFGSKLDEGEIYAANGLALGEAARQLGAEVESYRCRDEVSDMKRTFAEASSNADFVVTSGGVSVGKHDHVRSVWQEFGAEELFWRAAIRPGRPISFARIPGGATIFGLPGNPVSSLATFHLFIRPALLKFYGKPLDSWIKARTSYQMKSSETVEIFERVIYREGVIEPIVHQGSHMSSGMAAANALARIPRSIGTLPVGSSLSISPLTWTLP